MVFKVNSLDIALGKWIPQAATFVSFSFHTRTQKETHRVDFLKACKLVKVKG